ncbi:hypothetical protein TH63_19385 [Rufibacter radiotolerans]|uniref:Uncharacterized protein n=1 Tax=Rufibacter radiotolerans TaxID=1379910 RepID=A0A0H4VTP4_9BACT|nr:hypothetical protein TH63_19385 [Rufibacter radiotolerans]
MKSRKAVLLALLLIIPTLSFAHGEEIIYTLLIEVIVFFAFIIVLFLVRLNIKGKGILAAIYALTTLIMFSKINNIPFIQNMNLINWALVLVPCAVLALSYVCLRPKFYKQK